MAEISSDFSSKMKRMSVNSKEINGFSKPSVGDRALKEANAEVESVDYFKQLSETELHQVGTRKSHPSLED